MSLVLPALVAEGLAASPRHPRLQEPADRVVVLGRDYRLDRADDLRRLREKLTARMEHDQHSLVAWKTRRDEARAGVRLAELDEATLRAHFHPPGEIWSKRERRGFQELLQRISSFESGAGALTNSAGWAEIRELAAAIENDRRDPVPRVNLFTAGLLAFDFLDNSIGGGRREATNVVAAGADSSRLDPPASSFWNAERVIEEQNLYAGFGRGHLPDWSSLIWEYDEPKTSAGGNPGFEIRQENVRAKVKFAETTSEPFTARLFHALGYHADVTDHVPLLRVKYDRRLLREFNLRQPVMLHLRILGPPLVSRNLQRRFDPLDFVESAWLRDGSRLSADELREHLYLDPHMSEPAGDPANFNQAFERKIDLLVMRRASLQPDDPAGRGVGRWDYGQLNHRELRELRAAGLLAAWLGWFDCRDDNTSLRLRAGADAAPRLEHVFADLGGGLGLSDRGFNWRSESPDDFPWEFTRAPVDRGPGRMRTPFRVVRFHTITDNPAFRALTESDARWMARRIARLSREQITAALIASGHDAAETKLLLAKLVFRRDKLIVDLGLAEECGLLARPDEGRKFDFDPLKDTVPEVALGGKILRPPVGGQLILRGRIQPRDTGRPAGQVAEMR